MILIGFALLLSQHSTHDVVSPSHTQLLLASDSLATCPICVHTISSRFMLARDDGGAVPAVLCETLSGRLMPRDRSPIEDTTFDNPIERQKEAKTGRKVGRQALMTAVAISMCDHVRAGSSVPV